MININEKISKSKLQIANSNNIFMPYDLPLVLNFNYYKLLNAIWIGAY
jgi:hypothetical protein